MIDHLSTYAQNFDATVQFYDAALMALGFVRNANMSFADDVLPDRGHTPAGPRRACAYGPGSKPVFWVIEAGELVTPRHVAFAAESKDAVSAFYAAGLAAGGRDHGAPGPRTHYHPGYFGGFLLDPDGNNVEAVHHDHGVLDV